jgi:transcriptional regulator with XRE-family HTH domain
MPLDQLRKAQQMTQLQLAEILGVNQQPWLGAVTTPRIRQ